MTDLRLEEEDKEIEKIEGYNYYEQKNTLLPILYRLVLEDYEQEAKRILVYELLQKRTLLPKTEVCNKGQI